jgi:hypothetical protein
MGADVEAQVPRFGRFELGLQRRATDQRSSAEISKRNRSRESPDEDPEKDTQSSLDLVFTLHCNGLVAYLRWQYDDKQDRQEDRDEDERQPIDGPHWRPERLEPDAAGPCCEEEHDEKRRRRHVPRAKPEPGRQDRDRERREQQCEYGMDEKHQGSSPVCLLVKVVKAVNTGKVGVSMITRPCAGWRRRR